MSVFSAPAYDNHELVSFHQDPVTGLRAIIAVHNSVRGAAAGGCRMYPYSSDEAALHDVLRLSRGMTYKSALAELPFGGGKSVIIGDPQRQKSAALMRAMGDFVHTLGGRYTAAEDSGTSVADMRIMRERTPWVSGLDDNEFGGDPSPSTALGVFLGIRTAVRHRLGSDGLGELKVAIQGLGHVGFYLARLLRKEGATVYGADVNASNLQRAVQELGVTAVDPEEILFQQVDVLAPCAMGAVLNTDTIPRLRAGIVAGAANNQLATEEDGRYLQDRGILYCPDFLINAGGIIDVYHQRLGSGSEQKLAHIGRVEEKLLQVLNQAQQAHQPTHVIAEQLAEQYLQVGAAQESVAA
jgi:leucine dehydrogenase